MKYKIQFGGSSLYDEKGPPFVPNTRRSSQSLAYFHISTIIKSNTHLRVVVRRLFLWQTCTRCCQEFFTPLYKGVEHGANVIYKIIACQMFLFKYMIVFMATAPYCHFTLSSLRDVFVKSSRTLDMLLYVFCALICFTISAFP